VDPAAAESSTAASDPDTARPLFYFFSLFAGVCLAVVHEVFLRQRALYLEPGYGPRPWVVTVSAVGFGCMGVLASRHARGDPRVRFTWALLLLALAVTGSGPALFFTFGTLHGLSAAALGAAISSAFLLGASCHAGLVALERALAGLEFVRWATNPFRLLCGAAIVVAAAAAHAAIGVWRSAAALGMLLGILSSWAPALFLYLDRAGLRGARVARVSGFASFAIALGVFFLSLRFAPVSDYDSYVSEVIFARDGPHRRYVVTSGQRHFELFADKMLKVSGIDDYRFAESLVHPVFAVAERRSRVLILGMGDGLVEREVLRYPDVEQVTLVVTDAELARLSVRMGWLAARSERAIDSTRIEVIEAEPAVWLASARGSFDVAIVDLPDPVDHVEGKHYTTYFYRSLSTRLAERAVAVVQATSISSTPRTFASIQRTLQASGWFTLAYHAALPSLGDWGFVLISARPLRVPARVPSDLRFLNDRTLPGLFALPRELPGGDGDVSTLHRPTVVTTFAEERRAFTHEEP
jgi:spermidine synthase